MPSETFIVTGGLGCVGAWTLYHLVRQGERAICYDLGQNRSRLDLLLTRAEQEAITFLPGDITDGAAFTRAVLDHGVTHIIHLAALQVPFCRENPVLGAQVNVVGTVNVFEAARAAAIRHLALASSIAVYGPADHYPTRVLPNHAPLFPQTLYGVYKQANEGTARIYWQDHHISSTALRPYVVYGLGRDQGMTSDPTKALLAAAAGKPYHIAFGGSIQMQWASDVARQFILAAQEPLAGAMAFNLGGPIISIAEIAAHIQALVPGVAITYADKPLPFPEAFDDGELRAWYEVYQTPLAEAFTETLTGFRAALADGRLTA